MIQDLHSHTYYSFCGHDNPEIVIEAAISGGIELLGISDHNYGIAQQRSVTQYSDIDRRAKDYQRSLKAYMDHIRSVSKSYQSKIRVLCGIEVATLNCNNWDLPDAVDLSGFDFCLIESIDSEDTIADDLFSFAKRCGTALTGVAHTDLFSYLARTKQDPLDYFTKMAENHIFWELNVNYDSIHHYRRHQYVLDFFHSEYQQNIIRDSGIKLSIGFDGHRVEDYRPDIVEHYCRAAEELNLPFVFSDSF